MTGPPPTVICPDCKGKQWIQDRLPRTTWLPPKRFCRTCNAAGFVTKTPIVRTPKHSGGPGHAIPEHNHQTAETLKGQ